MSPVPEDDGGRNSALDSSERRSIPPSDHVLQLASVNRAHPISRPRAGYRLAQGFAFGLITVGAVIGLSFVRSTVAGDSWTRGILACLIAWSLIHSWSTEASGDARFDAERQRKLLTFAFFSFGGGIMLALVAHGLGATPLNRAAAANLQSAAQSFAALGLLIGVLLLLSHASFVVMRAGRRKPD